MQSPARKTCHHHLSSYGLTRKNAQEGLKKHEKESETFNLTQSAGMWAEVVINYLCCLSWASQFLSLKCPFFLLSNHYLYPSPSDLTILTEGVAHKMGFGNKSVRNLELLGFLTGHPQVNRWSFDSSHAVAQKIMEAVILGCNSLHEQTAYGVVCDVRRVPASLSSYFILVFDHLKTEIVSIQTQVCYFVKCSLKQLMKLAEES